MKYSYFPGCSLKGLGRAYEESLLPVMKHLGVELQELEDWNCCGATAYMAVDEAKACVLAARNLNTPDFFHTICELKGGGVAHIENTWIMSDAMPTVTERPDLRHGQRC